MLKNHNPIVCIGALNLDITAISNTLLVLGESNMGAVRIHAGGVARNVAENIAHICKSDLCVYLCACVGADIHGKSVLTHTENAGVDISLCTQIQDRATSTYVPIINSNGEMVTAINDMDIMTCITPAFLQQWHATLQSAQAICIDTGMVVETLEYICNTYGHIPIFVDTVSSVKAPRIKNALSAIYTLKATISEAEVVSGIPIATDADLAQATKILHQKGVCNVYITMGAEGTYASSVQSDKQQTLHRTAYQGTIVNATGAGDAYMAGLLYAHTQKYSLSETVDFAQSMAFITAQYAHTVNPHITLKNIWQQMTQYT